MAKSTSTYLLQHRDQPVDWWQWSPEALGEAQRRQVPIMLSIGYASCHWCHVMARESFVDEAVAAQINRDFVAIKVDREERPDVDAVYMTATQALTGHGGWPMTCFLTPAGRPFYAGTYFPPTPVSGLPAFRQVLSAIADAWQKDREKVLRAAADITSSLAGMAAADSTNGSGLDQAALADMAFDGVGMDVAALDDAAAAVLHQIDGVNGGFGGAPKFPPAMVCEFLLRQHERTGAQEALAAVELTLTRMARGGIADQLAGGFARYSVDSQWHVPHFEKMLDDNALLLAVYSHAARLTADPLFARTSAGIGNFLLTGLRTPDGAFAASLDADTRGVEGATYLWTQDQLIEALGEQDGRRAAELFGLTLDDHPPDLDGCVLRLPADPPDDLGPTWFERIRRALLEVRDLRPQPGRDDLVVLRSNGLAIRALSEAGAVQGRPDWIAAAADAATYLERVHLLEGRWCRSSRDGRVGPSAAVLSDHGDLAGGLLALHQATGNPHWLDVATSVLDLVLAHFGTADGGFHDTAQDSAELFLRPRDPGDGAAPSGASAVTDALVTASAMTGSPAYRRAAERALLAIRPLLSRMPRSAGWHLSAAEALANGPVQVAVVGRPGPAREELALTARKSAPGGSVFGVGEPDSPGLLLLADRPLIGGRPAAYVCRGFVCDRPVTDSAELVALLRRRSVGRAGDGGIFDQ